MTPWYRRPLARMIAGYALVLPTAIPFSWGVDALFSLFAPASVATLTLGWGSIALLYGALFLGIYLFNLKREHDYKKATAEFDSTPTGKKISRMIKEICKKNNLPVPYRQLSYEKRFSAAAQSWPNPRRILISKKNLFERVKNNTICDEDAKFILGHELGHIYHYHSLHSISQVLPDLGNFLFYASMGLSVLLILNIGVMGLLGTSIGVETLAALGYLQITNFTFWITQKVSNLGAKMVSRAVESQAELKGCEFTSPQAGYRHNLQAINHRKPITEKQYDSYFDQFSAYGKQLLHGYYRWLATHPTAEENAEDIAALYPKVKAIKEKEFNKYDKKKIIRC